MKKRPRGTVAAAAVRPFLEVGREFDEPVDLGLSWVGLSTSDLEQAGARLSHGKVIALLQGAVVQFGRPERGLLAALRIDSAQFGMLEVAARSQPTLGEALKTLQQLIPLVHDHVSFRLEQEGGQTCAVGELETGFRGHPVATEFGFAALIRFVRYATGQPDYVATLQRLRHEAPADASLHEEIFGCPLEFEADHDALVMPTADLGLPLAWTDDLASAALVQSAKTMVEKLRTPDSWDARVARIAERHLELGDCTAEPIAKELGVTLRTLQRKLSAEATSVKTVIDRERARMADNYLKNPHLTFDEIADRLGFASTPGLHRAIKRWTGSTSVERRKELMGES